MRIQGGGGFENAGGGCPDGDESVCGSSFFGEASWNFVMFGVHGVISEILCFDGAEGAEAYVESDKGVGKLGEEFRGEVEACGWGSDGAQGLGVSGLIVDGVGGLEIELALDFS
jgi:hypothetical protein